MQNYRKHFIPRIDLDKFDVGADPLAARLKASRHVAIIGGGVKLPRRFEVAIGLRVGLFGRLFKPW
jgi:hypothetical protein